MATERKKQQDRERMQRRREFQASAIRELCGALDDLRHMSPWASDEMKIEAYANADATLEKYLIKNGNMSDEEFYTRRDGYWEDPRSGKLKGRIENE